MICYRCGGTIHHDPIPITHGGGRYEQVCSMRCARAWKVHEPGDDYATGYGEPHPFAGMDWLAEPEPDEFAGVLAKWEAAERRRSPGYGASVVSDVMKQEFVGAIRDALHQGSRLLFSEGRQRPDIDARVAARRAARSTPAVAADPRRMFTIPIRLHRGRS